MLAINKILKNKLSLNDNLKFVKNFFSISKVITEILSNIRNVINKEDVVNDNDDNNNNIAYKFDDHFVIILENLLLNLRDVINKDSSILLKNLNNQHGVGVNDNNEHTLFQLLWILILQIKFIIYWIVVLNDDVDIDVSCFINNKKYFSYLLIHAPKSNCDFYKFNISTLHLDSTIMESDFINVVEIFFEFSSLFDYCCDISKYLTRLFLEILELKFATYIIFFHNTEELNHYITNTIKKMLKFVNDGSLFTLNAPSVTLLSYCFFNHFKILSPITNQCGKNGKNVIVKEISNKMINNLNNYGNRCIKAASNDFMDNFSKIYKMIKCNLIMGLKKKMSFEVVTKSNIFDSFIINNLVNNNSYHLYNYANDELISSSMNNENIKIHDVVQKNISQKEYYYYKRIINNKYVAIDLMLHNILLPSTLLRSTKNMIIQKYIQIILGDSNINNNKYNYNNIFRSRIKKTSSSNYIVNDRSQQYILIINSPHNLKSNHIFSNPIDAFVMWIMIEFSTHSRINDFHKIFIINPCVTLYKN